MPFGYVFETADLALFVTLVFLEGALSLDNAAVLAAMVRKLPFEQRRKALLYGLGGAYAMRITALFFASLIIANPFLKVVGGGYLVFLAVKHLFFEGPSTPIGPSSAPSAGMKLLSKGSFWAVVIAIEITDLAFALDQIVASVAFTTRLPVIIAASMVAILLLRISAAYMSRLMDWFPALEKLAYVAVAFVGAKLLIVEAAHYLGYVDFEIGRGVSLGVTLALLVVPVFVKLIYERFSPRADRG